MQFGKNKKTTAISATRLGNFLKFLATNLYTKVAQLYDEILKNIFFNRGYFWGNLWKIGLLFIPTSGHTDTDGCHFLFTTKNCVQVSGLHPDQQRVI